MNKLEKFIVAFVVLWALVYTPVFLYLFFVQIPSPDTFMTLMPFHLLGMALNGVAFIITIRDLYLREFEKENAKITWALLIFLTGGIGWLIYVFKYAVKPRVQAASPLGRKDSDYD